MKTKYDFYQDSGHGWVKVSIKELSELSLLDKITPYSYYKKGYVYLEEDCDLNLFYKAKENKGIIISFSEHHSERSKIRHFQYYDKVKAIKTDVVNFLNSHLSIQHIGN